MSRIKYLFALVMLSGCAALPKAPPAGSDADAQAAFAAVVRGFELCPYDGRLTDSVFVKGLIMPAKPLYDLGSASPLRASRMDLSQYTKTDPYRYSFESPEPNVRVCSIELRQWPSPLSWSHPALRAKVSAMGLTAYPRSFAHYKFNIFTDKSGYYGEVPGVAGFPFSQRFDEFARYVAASFGGGIVAEGVYDPKQQGFEYGYAPLAKLILLPDNISHILIVYDRAKGIRGNDYYRDFGKDFVRLEGVFVKPDIVYKTAPWSAMVPCAEVPEGKTRYAGVNASGEATGMCSYQLPKVRRVERWPDPVSDAVLAPFLQAFAWSSQDEGAAWRDRRAEIQRHNAAVAANSAYTAQGIRQQLADNQAFYSGLDRSTQQTVQAVERMADEQRRQAREAQPQAAPVNRSAIKPPAPAAATAADKPAATSASAGNPVSVSTAVAKPAPAEKAQAASIVRREAMSYCWKTENARWRCHTPAQKLIVSEPELSEVEKLVCQHRKKMPVKDGFAYFCGYAIEPHEQDVYETYGLYGLAGERRSYACSAATGQSGCAAE